MCDSSSDAVYRCFTIMNNASFLILELLCSWICMYMCMCNGASLVAPATIGSNYIYQFYLMLVLYDQ